MLSDWQQKPNRICARADNLINKLEAETEQKFQILLNFGSISALLYF